MIDIPSLLASEFRLQPWQVSNTLALFSEGATIPFVARYRKEKTGELDEIVLRTLKDRFDYLTELEERRSTILASIEEQGKLTPELKAKILATSSKTELEDLYLPYRPKRRTRATIAKERGLEPLADQIRQANVIDGPAVDLSALAAAFVDPSRDVNDVSTALAGASDILAEELAERAEIRQTLRAVIVRDGVFVSRKRSDVPEGPTKFDAYDGFRAPVASIAAHQMLAMRRGEADNILVVSIEIDEDAVLDYLRTKVILSPHVPLIEFLSACTKDTWQRLLKISLITDVRMDRKKLADETSIATFGANLRELLLAPPAGMKPVIGIDPGFRTGCKIAVVDGTGRFVEYATVFPTAGSDRQKHEAAVTLSQLISKYSIELIAVGNGTAGRETQAFVEETLSTLPEGTSKPVHVMVSEAGASVYSASEVASAEFPDLDLTIRGAISIARRLQDPLAELVKIDPKSIGVGQYQHDVDQKALKNKLDETVESCVNYVGVDLNLASRELLSFVSGLTPSLAKSIVDYRNANGPFTSRQDLLKVPKFGPKTFEQAAGFLRIRGGSNPLDASAVHPERYQLVERIAKDLDVPLERITSVPERIRSLDVKRYVGDGIGEPTLRDVVAELEKPGRDPRAQFTYAQFAEGVKEITDLTVGMELEGVVTNVANFGAFVDIGVHQDGLVHISQLSNRFVKDPKDVVKVGQVVRVRVVEVDVRLKRIALTMKLQADGRDGGKSAGKQGRDQRPTFSVDDLKARFSR